VLNEDRKPAPMGVRAVFAKERPDALPVPAAQNVSSLPPASALDRWGDIGAGIVRSEADNTLSLFGQIGEDFWGEGITTKSTSERLKSFGGKDIELHINSPGGDMFEGIAIYNLLREYEGNVKVKVMGMAASAGSLIAMAGDTIEIGASSFLMIHNCWIMAIGNRHDLKEASEWLEPFDEAMAGIYAQRSGADLNKIKGWLDKETYMSGAQAIERGFADDLLPADQIKIDENQKKTDEETNALRSMELALVNSGLTRTQARAHIKKIKGMHDAAPEPGVMQDADTILTAGLSSLISSLQGEKQ